MLKFFKILLIAIGIVLIAATIILMVWDIIQINHLVTTANAANMSVNSNPGMWVLLAVAGTLVGGFALGFGLAMPKRTFKQRVQDQAVTDTKATSANLPPSV